VLGHTQMRSGVLLRFSISLVVSPIPRRPRSAGLLECLMATRRTRPRHSIDQSSQLDSMNIEISNPTKALYPSGYTKAQIIEYYIELSSKMG
jgi:hypothetical protein